MKSKKCSIARSIIMSFSLQDEPGKLLFTNCNVFVHVSIRVMTGTSQAAPHVSGVVAQYLEREPYATEEDVLKKLLETAAQGVIEDTKACEGYQLPLLARYIQHDFS